MRTSAIKTLTQKTGNAATAATFWQAFVDNACGGIEPNEAMFASLDKSEALAALSPLHRAVLSCLWPDTPTAPKGRKFKAENPRKYTAAEIVSFIAADPKQDGLRAEYMRRTGGEPALFYVDDKLREAESAERIQRLFDRDPVAPFVTIDGREVKPSGYPDDAPKEDKEDPYDPGTRLGQPGDVSMRLGVSLAGIDHETRQAIRCAVTLDLADASTRELQADAAAAKGCSAIEYLANKPKSRREWPTWKKSPLVMPRKAAPGPFADPPAASTAQRGGDVARPSGWIPTIYVHGVDDNEADWDKLASQLDTAVAAGQIRLLHRRMMPAGGEVEKRLADMWKGADGMLVLVSADTFAAANRWKFDVAVKDFARPIVPVILRACIWQAVPELESLGPIPSSGKALTTTGEWTEAAMDILAFVRTLRPRAALAARPTWGPEMLRQVQAAIVTARLADSRHALLSGIDLSIAGSLPRADNAATQVYQDLNNLPRALPDGSNPLREYLANAAHLSRKQREEVVFREAMSALDA